MAKTRRKELEDESNFYGAMDGANKFVRGDAIAGLMITFINFIAGILIGLIQRDMSFSNAIETYTILTIGDGLVSQIPAILVSTAAGLLVTKSGVVGSAEKAVLGQLGSSSQALWVTSILLLFMGLLPGLPMIPFVTMSLIVGSIAFFVTNNPESDTSVAAAMGSMPSSTTSRAASATTGSSASDQEGTSQDSNQTEEQAISQTLAIDSLRLELGYGLLPLINYQRGHRLTDQIRALRTQLAKDLGFVMPSVRIQDNMHLDTNEYIIKVKNIECGKGVVKPEMLLVMDPKGGTVNLPGEDTTEPAFGLPAKWINESHR